MSYAIPWGPCPTPGLQELIARAERTERAEERVRQAEMALSRTRCDCDGMQVMCPYHEYMHDVAKACLT